MRNCFVPGCDSYCKANGCIQRKMFSAPKTMVSQWREVLPRTKRDFKDNDRVCERHFEPDEITEYWENNINGIVHRTKRDKPKLNSTAVPSRNLEVNNLNSTLAKKSQQQQKAIKTRAAPKRPINVINYEIYTEDDGNLLPSETVQVEEECIPAKRLKNEDAEELKRTKNAINVQQQQQSAPSENIQMNCSPIRETNEPIDEAKLEAFEILYDEIHDVTLPSTEWGIHRCSERKFLVFSKFSSEQMGYSKFLYISEQLKCKILVNGKSKTEDLEKEKCNSQHVSEWLEKIDEEE